MKEYLNAWRMCLLIFGCIMINTTPESFAKKANNSIQSERAIHVRYRNWRNEVAIRTIIPQGLFWGSTEWHKEEQWLLRVWDVERQAERIYAFKDIQEILSSKSNP